MCVVSRSSFNEFAQRYGRDERFKAVEKMREREQLFAEHLQTLKKAPGKHKERGEGPVHSHASSTRFDRVHVHCLTKVIMCIHVCGCGCGCE